MIGGYKIIDLDGYSLTIGGGSVTIHGIFEQISESKKAMLIENLTVTSEGSVASFSPFFVDFVPTDETLTAVVLGGRAAMTIAPTDAVTLTAVSE